MEGTGMIKGRPTMRDVAELAGVTQPTVSYAINGTANISQEVKEKIDQAIKELNYKPNYFARVLKTNKSNIIGIIIPDISNEYYSRMINIVDKILTDKGYTLVINSTNYDKKAEEKNINQLINYSAEGIIVMYQLGNSTCWEQLRESKQSVVVLEGGNKCKDIPCINIDNHLGGYIATKHLLDKGRRSIAYIGQNSEIDALADRFQGYIDAMKEYQLPYDNLIYKTHGPGNKWEEGTDIGKQLSHDALDGIVVSSDIIAVGILRTLMLSGKKVPQDISIVGYDNIPISQLFVPALTTIAQPVEIMCRLAVNGLLQNMNNNKKKMRNKLLLPHLITRETT